VDKSNLRFEYLCRMDDDLYMNIDELVEHYQLDMPSVRVYSGAAWYAGQPHRRGVVWCGVMWCGRVG
jgi:hypothetical protein